jgi:hypothetical protein
MGEVPEKPADDKPEPTLELPSLRLPGLGRKKKAKPAKTPTTPTTSATAEEPEQSTHPVATATDTQPVPVADPSPDRHAEPTQDTTPEPAPGRTPEPLPRSEAETPLLVDDEEPPAADDQEDEAPGSPREFALPVVAPQLAVVIVGLVIGVLGTLLTYGSLQGCQSVRGTQSCGGTGLFLLFAILVIMGLLGGVLLKLWKLSDPQATSFLAIGVLCVVILVTLMEELFSAWMFVVVPIICAASYSLSRWVTTRFIEPAERGPTHDIR